MFRLFSAECVAKLRCKRTIFYCLIVGLLFTIAVALNKIYSLNLVPYYVNPKISKSVVLGLLTDSSHDGHSSRNDSASTRNVKRILFWTTFFDIKHFGFGVGQEPFVQAGCRVTNCMATTNRSLASQSDAILFHPVNMDLKDLPSNRISHQRYIFFFYEALINYRSLPAFQNAITNRKFFNWTMTYRRDSDIYGTLYGGIRRRPDASNKPQLSRYPSTLSPEDFPPEPDNFWQLRGLNQSQQHPDLVGKTKLVAWFVSNCDTPSRREIFFRQVAKFIPVDVYGNCGSLKCERDNSAECNKLLNTYKFYVSAENSLCADYVTEKLYKTFEIGTVPIVYGGADYSAYAPPHSYINAADFESPQALADYLLTLDRNPRLYSEYLGWKNDWEIDKHTELDGWCHLCEKLNDPSEGQVDSFKIYEDIAGWLYDKVPCLPGTLALTKFGIS